MILTIVTGLIEEAQCFTPRDDIQVLWGNARDNLDTYVARGCTQLVSFGVSGALDPSLVIGDLVIPTTVVNANESYSATFDPFNLSSLSSIWAKQGIEYSSGNVEATTPEARAALFHAYRATSIDDEAIHVARFAVKNNIPWSVIRSISDTTTTTIPAWMLLATDSHGKSSFAEIIKGLEAHPSDAINLIEVGINFEKAIGTLRRTAKIIELKTQS